MNRSFRWAFDAATFWDMMSKSPPDLVNEQGVDLLRNKQNPIFSSKNCSLWGFTVTYGSNTTPPASRTMTTPPATSLEIIGPDQKEISGLIDLIKRTEVGSRGRTRGRRSRAHRIDRSCHRQCRRGSARKSRSSGGISPERNPQAEGQCWLIFFFQRWIDFFLDI